MLPLLHLPLRTQAQPVQQVARRTAPPLGMEGAGVPMQLLAPASWDAGTSPCRTEGLRSAGQCSSVAERAEELLRREPSQMLHGKRPRHGEAVPPCHRTRPPQPETEAETVSSDSDEELKKAVLEYERQLQKRRRHDTPARSSGSLGPETPEAVPGVPRVTETPERTPPPRMQDSASPAPRRVPAGEAVPPARSPAHTPHVPNFTTIDIPNDAVLDLEQVALATQQLAGRLHNTATWLRQALSTARRAQHAGVVPWSILDPSLAPTWVAAALARAEESPNYLFNEVLSEPQRCMWETLPRPWAAQALSAAPFLTALWQSREAFDGLYHVTRHVVFSLGPLRHAQPASGEAVPPRAAQQQPSPQMFHSSVRVPYAPERVPRTAM
jgi:hypothetical protein